MKKLSVVLGIIACLTTIAFSTNRPVFADHVGEDSTIILTNNLLALVKQYMRAEAMDQEQLMAKIKDVIDQRKAQLIELMETNPDAVGHLLLPPEVVEGLPAD